MLSLLSSAYHGYSPHCGYTSTYSYYGCLRHHAQCRHEAVARRRGSCVKGKERQLTRIGCLQAAGTAQHSVRVITEPCTHNRPRVAASSTK